MVWCHFVTSMWKLTLLNVSNEPTTLSNSVVQKQSAMQCDWNDYLKFYSWRNTTLFQMCMYTYKEIRIYQVDLCGFSKRMIFSYPFRFLSYKLRYFQCELFHFEYELRKTHHSKAIENVQHHVLHITIYFAPTNGSMRSFCLWFNIRFIPSKLASLWCVDVLSLTSFNWLIVFID